VNKLDYMFDPGFFGTRAPFFMDFVTLIVAILPLLVAGAILFARHKHYKIHTFLQIIILAVSVIVLLYFEFGVREIGGFNYFMEDSSVGYGYAFAVLVFHIAVSVITLIIWAKTIFMARKQIAAHKHKRAGIITFFAVVATSLTGIWVYILMFVY